MTLGASITATTLARTAIYTTATGMNSTPTFHFNAPSAINIGTAANVLVFVSPLTMTSVLPALWFTGCNSSTLSRDGLGVPPLLSNTQMTSGSVSNDLVVYVPFFLPSPLLVTTATCKVSAGGSYTGANNNLYFGLYHINSTNGYPGKLIADFRVLGSANASFGTASAAITSGTLGSPVLLYPGWYFAAIKPVWTTGGTGTPGLFLLPVAAQIGGTSVIGFKAGFGLSYLYASSSTSTMADPATTPTAAIPNPSPMFWLGT